MFKKSNILKVSTIIIVVLSLISNLQAKVIYTVVDSTLSGTEFMDAKQFYLDFNQDNICEFFLSHANQGMGESSYVCEIYSCNNNNDNEVLVHNNNRNPILLNHGYSIDRNYNGWYDSYNGVSTMAMYFEDEWAGNGPHFVGLRFKTNGKYHYGWVYVNIPFDLSKIIVMGFAWEDSPETAITTTIPTNVFIEKDLSTNAFIEKIGNIVTFQVDNKYNIEIYDLCGKLIYSKLIENEITEVDTNEFNSGIYVIVLKSISGYSISKLFVF